MASNINVVFSADTGRFVAQIDAATGAVNATSAAFEKAKNGILESMEASDPEGNRAGKIARMGGRPI